MDELENPYVVYNDEWTWRDYVSLAVFPFVLIGCCVAGLVCDVLIGRKVFRPYEVD